MLEIILYEVEGSQGQNSLWFQDLKVLELLLNLTVTIPPPHGATSFSFSHKPFFPFLAIFTFNTRMLKRKFHK